MSDARGFRIDPHKMFHVIGNDKAWKRATTSDIEVKDMAEVFPKLGKSEVKTKDENSHNATGDISFDRLLEVIVFQQQPTTSPPRNGKKTRTGRLSKSVLHEIKRIAQ